MQAHCESKAQFKVTLEMGETETREVRDLCQNPFIENEPEILTRLRGALFEALYKNPHL